MLPRPRRVRSAPGSYCLKPGAAIVCEDQTAPGGLIAIRALRRLVQGYAGSTPPVRQGGSGNGRASGGDIRVVLDDQGGHVDQGYALKVRPEGIEIRASDGPGLYWGVQTLGQLMAGAVQGRNKPRVIRSVDIRDWPDFPVRGVMLDISRDKIPTLATLKALIDRLSAWKINQLQLYTEHAFAYQWHEAVWRGSSPMTGPQIELLDQYCRERCIELVPNQNSFGHMERWLKHPAYRTLAEMDRPWKTPWGGMREDPTTLNPLDPNSLRLVSSLYDQLLPHFTSDLFNVGCDETFELGQGKSGSACRRRGVGRVYLDFLKKIHREVRRRGRRMMFWSDVAQQHPELIRELPQDAIPMIWGYEAGHPWKRQCERVAKTGLDFYVCPGTSSWCSFAGRSANCLTNLREAAKIGLQHGATGYLMTDWGDYGHRQYLPASYMGFLYGAAVSWCTKAHASMDVPRQAGLSAFDDDTGIVGQLWHDAGCVHEVLGLNRHNQTPLFACMQAEPADAACLQGATRRRVRQAEDRVARILTMAKRVNWQGEEGALVKAELETTLGVLRHACRRAALMIEGDFAKSRSKIKWLADDMQKIIARHRALWLARNRRGGLADSLAWYRHNLKQYDQMLR